MSTKYLTVVIVDKKPVRRLKRLEGDEDESAEY